MIRHATLAASASMLLLVVGCAQNDHADDPGYAVADDGLAIHATADLAVARPGEEIIVTGRLENTSAGPIKWNSPTAGPWVVLHLQKQSELDMGLWQDAKMYPNRMFATVITPRKLAAGEKKLFKLTIPVEPSWPRGEMVRLAVHPYGRREPTGTIKVKIPAQGESDE
jgi:hypothetical protein